MDDYIFKIGEEKNISSLRFKVDISALEDIEVREPYVPLGGCAYFTKDAEILGIIYQDVVYLPHDSDWEYPFFFDNHETYHYLRWIKFHWRSSVFVPLHET